jgi:hypothetical protein
MEPRIDGVAFLESEAGAGERKAEKVVCANSLYRRARPESVQTLKFGF